MNPLFSTISLEIGSKCNRKCWFCPNSVHKRPNEFMPTALIKKILYELQYINYSKRIELYIYNEPLLHKDLCSIIAMCRNIIPRSTIMIATNGDLIKSSKQIHELYKAGLNQLQVNVYSNVKRYRVLKGILLKVPNIVEGNIYENTSSIRKVYSLEQKFDRKLTPTSPKIGRFELSNRSGLVPKLKVLKPVLDRTCVRPFRFMQVNWKGEVIICCNDYLGKVICGDATKASVIDIWNNSPVYKKYRKKLLAKDRSGLPLCKHCSFKGGAYTYLIHKQWCV